MNISSKMNGENANSFRENDPHFATKATHVGQDPEQWNSMAVIPPITLATTFKQVCSMYLIVFGQITHRVVSHLRFDNFYQIAFFLSIRMVQPIIDNMNMVVVEIRQGMHLKDV